MVFYLICIPLLSKGEFKTEEKLEYYAGMTNELIMNLLLIEKI